MFTPINAHIEIDRVLKRVRMDRKDIHLINHLAHQPGGGNSRRWTNATTTSHAIRQPDHHLARSSPADVRQHPFCPPSNGTGRLSETLQQANRTIVHPRTRNQRNYLRTNSTPADLIFTKTWLDQLPGSLTFDIPAGEGDIKVQCQTFPGYHLNLQIEGQAAVSTTQTTPGEATVHYNVANPVHVVIYLHATGGSSAPARIATRMEDAVTVGAYIQAVTIQPANAPLQPTAIDQVVTPSNGSEKILRNGQLLILRDGKIFNAQGAQVR